jgi:uncharacterized protein YjbI with pentapeptide repeats
LTALQVVLLVVIGLVMAFGGWLLWRPPPTPGEAKRSLGTSLITGAAISLAFFALTQVTASHQQEIADQQTLRLTIGFQNDLSGADLSGKNLDNFDLAKKNLSDADLERAQLERARLIGTVLDRANLKGAKLSGAYLEGAWLRKTSLDGADLAHAHLNGAHLEDAEIGPGVDGKSASLIHAVLVDAHLQRACLASADLRGSVMGGADLGEAVLTEADLRDARPELDGIPANIQGAAVARIKADANIQKFLSARTIEPAREILSAVSSGVVIHAQRDLVTSISDGDTIELKKLGWMRLIGLDAPNNDDASGVGEQARAFVEHVLRQQPSIRYKLGPQPREIRPGNIGRWQGYIWLANGHLLNEMLLEGGYARRQANQHEDPQYAPLLQEAQRRAMVAGRRIWANCSGR